MKKGMILYIVQGDEDVPEDEPKELIEAAISLGVSAVWVANTEDEVIHGWWRLVVKGMHQVLLMTVAYDPLMGKFEFRRGPLRLHG